MCCRYYINDGTIEELSDLLQDRRPSFQQIISRDIHPGDTAPIIKYAQSGLILDEMKWGLYKSAHLGHVHGKTSSPCRIAQQSGKGVLFYRECALSDCYIHKLKLLEKVSQ